MQNALQSRCAHRLRVESLAFLLELSQELALLFFPYTGHGRDDKIGLVIVDMLPLILDLLKRPLNFFYSGNAISFSSGSGSDSGSSLDLHGVGNYDGTL